MMMMNGVRIFVCALCIHHDLMNSHGRCEYAKIEINKEQEEYLSV